VIAADGHPKATEVLGGHPLLVEALERRWKSGSMHSAIGESTALLEFDFHPYTWGYRRSGGLYPCTSPTRPSLPELAIKKEGAFSSSLF